MHKSNHLNDDKWKFTRKVDLVSLKYEADKLDVDKSGKVIAGLNRMKNKADKLNVDKLVQVHVDLSKISDVVKKYDIKKTEYDELAKKTNAIQTTDTSNLNKKTDYDPKIKEIKKKIMNMIIVISLLLHKDLTKLTAEHFPPRLAEANLASKNDNAVYVKDFDETKLK